MFIILNTSLFPKFVNEIRLGFRSYTVKREWLLVICSLFFAITLNTAFFEKVFEIYPLGWSNAIFHGALFVILLSITVFLLNLLCFRFTTKPTLILLLIVCSLSNYFMGTYGIVMNTEMLTNILQTSPAESLDLASPALFANLILFGILPSYFILRAQIDYGSLRRGIASHSILAFMTLILTATALFSSGPSFASFFREHKSIRYRANPIAFIYAIGKLASENPIETNFEIASIAQDATINSDATGKKLVIFVVGETARADRFSLNGYERETNPLLSKEDIVNLTNVSAAGTSTAISVPCMFSHMGRESFSLKNARRTENLLDILDRVGVSVLWRDNNSDSKGVALRVAYEDFKDGDLNPIGEDEPRDEGMLYGLHDYISQQDGDILIVLHQMGSHGPAYYKRYPKEFEIFTPVCESNQLEKCSQAEIDNAYDNTILYTDYVLSKVISLLKEYDNEYETAMLYFSDHGESLGEGNMYLHGYPYSLAPKEQKHVPAVLWFGESFPIDKDAISKRAEEEYSHDNIFHTMLGLFNVDTTQRNETLDIVAAAEAYLPQRQPIKAALAYTNKKSEAGKATEIEN